MDFNQIKQESKDVLVGNRLMLFVILFIVGIITAALGAVYIGFIIVPLVSAGEYFLIKYLIQTRSVVVEKLYNEFDDLTHAIKIIAVGIIVQLIITVGLILFIIPGIIFGLRYSQALRIISENKDMDIMDALTESRAMMEGHKMDLFMFYLSFIGHFLLIIITFGIYGFYFMPYFVTCDANYYLHLSGQNNVPNQYLDHEYEVNKDDYNY